MIQCYSHYQVEWGFLRIIKVVHNIFRENDGNENCAQVLEEECIKICGTKYLNDEHDYNVVSMNSLNIHSTNDDCTSYDGNVSYKHVDFCGVHRVCKYTPIREDERTCGAPMFGFGN